MLTHSKRGRTTSLGLTLLALLLAITAVARRRATVGPIPSAPPLPHAALTSSDAALCGAWHVWLRALAATDRERYAVEERDPPAASAVDPEVWRAQIMARAHGQDLRVAWQLGKRAEALARIPDQAYRATELLTHIAYDPGDRKAELAEARRLVALAPRSPSALRWLRYAAWSNHLQALVWHADAELAVSPRGSGLRKILATEGARQ